MITIKQDVLSVLAASVLLLAACSGSDSGSSGGDGDVVTGTGGSTARMTISGDYLYAIAGRNVQLFDISQPQTPVPYTQVQIDWDIQTLYPYGDYLLIGAADGVHIMDNTIPASPQYVGDFRHARALDPVVAQGGYAYVTLKRDPAQPGTVIANQMNVLDISDITQPRLVETISMQGPSGLSVQGDRLFVCDGVAGLKTFDLTNPASPVFSDTLNGVDCLDVIARDQHLFVIEEPGLSQYSTETGTPVLLSTIESEPVVYVVDR